MQWNTEVYFDGRYCLTMQVIVKVDRQFSKIVEVVGEPKFYLIETESVELLKDGRVAANAGSQQYEFGLSDWNKVVAAKGDLSAIGIHLKRNQAVAHFDRYVQAMRGPRIQVRPDCKQDADHEGKERGPGTPAD